MKNSQTDIPLPRRQFLKHALLAVPVLVAVSPIAALAKPAPQRTLSFSHTHTGEQLSVEYARDGKYLPEALDRINHHLRDFRREEIHAIDPALMDLLYDVQMAAGNPDGVFEVVSGYRSPKTNSMLRNKSQGVAKRSLHMQGMAIDIRLRGTDTKTLRNIAIDLKRGGTGYYASSDFIHLDTGRVRQW